MQTADVQDMIKVVNSQLRDLIKIHYFDLPEWVNEELFTASLMKKMIVNLSEGILTKMQDYTEIYKNKPRLSRDFYENDGSAIVELANRNSMAFALVSNEFVEPDYDDEITLHEYQIILSRKTIKYIIDKITLDISGFDKYQAAKKALIELFSM